MQEESHMVSSTWKFYLVVVIEWMMSPDLLCGSEDWRLNSGTFIRDWTTLKHGIYLFSCLRAKEQKRRKSTLPIKVLIRMTCALDNGIKIILTIVMRSFICFMMSISFCDILESHFYPFYLFMISTSIMS